jgi:hypothetical protein
MAGTVITPLAIQSYDVDAIEEAFIEVIDDSLSRMEADFNKITETWNHDVVFTRGIDFFYGFWEGFLETDDDVFNWVDQGTEPHEISPRPDNVRGILEYLSDFTPKTSWQEIGSSPGGKSGGLVQQFAVDHPGIDAREFSEAVSEKEQEHFERRLRRKLILNSYGVIEG